MNFAPELRRQHDLLDPNDVSVSAPVHVLLPRALAKISTRKNCRAATIYPSCTRAFADDQSVFVDLK